jgi:CHAT domain-containing protein
VEEVKRVADVFRAAGWSDNEVICLNDSDATVGTTSSAVESCSILHMACHGVQDASFTMNSGFLLHDGHLQLGQIVEKRLTSAQFTFLSVCHAASGVQPLPGEAMHLAAAVQFAGFSSIIATMWDIRDDDAPKVAEETYRHLFRGGLLVHVPNHKDAASSCAVMALRRDKEVTLDRWAAFIHFGA